MKKKRKYSFEAKIRKEPTTFFYVVTTAAVSRALARRSVPIVASLNGGQEFKATLMPRKGGLHVLFLRGAVRKDAGVGLGDRVTIAFDVDAKSREIETPEEVIEALRSEDLLDAYELITPGVRRQLLIHYGQAVQDATREKRIAYILEHAHAAREKQADRARARR